MLLNLVVCKFEDLQTIWEGGLGGLSLCKIVHDLLVWVGLLDIVVIEVDNGVSVGEDFPLNSIVEDDLFFPILINPLNLTIMANDLLNHFHVSWVLAVVDWWELHIEIFLLFFVRNNWRHRILRRLIWWDLTCVLPASSLLLLSPAAIIIVWVLVILVLLLVVWYLILILLLMMVLFLLLIFIIVVRVVKVSRRDWSLLFVFQDSLWLLWSLTK